MRAREHLLAIGIMTGNSLDAADAVLTRVDRSGAMRDLASHSLPYSDSLRGRMRELRGCINDFRGHTQRAIEAYDQSHGMGAFDALHEEYLTLLGRVVETLAHPSPERVDLIGLHGQTCAHASPSIAKRASPPEVYTVQLGDGQRLSNLTGLSVVYDFRSDDLMAGGEAAPFAPMHHRHLARELRREGHYPLAFVNAGNTANLTVITLDSQSGEDAVMGWDAGPFNHYPDALAQAVLGQPCDRDGRNGLQGRVDSALLRHLYERAVVTEDGTNFLLRLPPKSSDPQWYRAIPGLFEGPLPLNDRLRTAEYFAAYVCFHTLSLLPVSLQMPRNFALCGGGWRNPVSRNHFEALIRGDWDENTPILPEHQAAFEHIRSRLIAAAGAPSGIRVQDSSTYGFDGAVMEARIFADAAVCRIQGTPFTDPQITGAKHPVVCGLIRHPHGDEGRATPTLRAWLDMYQSRNLTFDRPQRFDPRWSRASAGWAEITRASA